MSHERMCLDVFVPKDACSVWFSDRAYPEKEAYTEELKYRTIRGEEVILRLTEGHRLIGLELLGDKPCQKA